MADGGSWRPPRPCEAYRAEWKLCRSARHRLHHYYVHGERPACEQWRRDLVSCREWEERRSAEAQRSLCESERARVQTARKHTLVWALRRSPPADWHLPLPQEEKDKKCEIMASWKPSGGSAVIQSRLDSTYHHYHQINGKM